MGVSGEMRKANVVTRLCQRAQPSHGAARAGLKLEPSSALLPERPGIQLSALYRLTTFISFPIRQISSQSQFSRRRRDTDIMHIILIKIKV